MSPTAIQCQQPKGTCLSHAFVAAAVTSIGPRAPYCARKQPHPHPMSGGGTKRGRRRAACSSVNRRHPGPRPCPRGGNYQGGQHSLGRRRQKGAAGKPGGGRGEAVAAPMAVVEGGADGWEGNRRSSSCASSAASSAPPAAASTSRGAPQGGKEVPWGGPMASDGG